MSDYKKTRNYLHYRRGHTVSSAHKTILCYGERNGIKITLTPEDKDYLKHYMRTMKRISEIIQCNWSDFMSFYSTLKKPVNHAKAKEYRARGKNKKQEIIPEDYSEYM